MLYLAYGSNLNVRQMRFRCPDAKPIAKCNINDYRLMFKGSKTGSYLTIEKDKGSKVPVVIWDISDTDKASLDRYEGYPTFYYIKEFPVVINGKKDTAIAYIMHEERVFGIPSEAYVRTCYEGYCNFGLDDSYLFEAVEYTKERA